MEMVTKLKVGLSYLLVLLLGGHLGGISGWLVGRIIYFLLAEWPLRNLPPEQFLAQACGLNLSIGMLTFLILIPLGVIAGTASSVRFWNSV